MHFTSLVFPIFLAVCFLLYFRLKRQGQNILLLIASSVFYGWWDWRFLFLLWGSIAINYWVGARIYNAKNKREQKYWLLASLVVCLGTLAYFKYANFFIDGFAKILSVAGLQVNEFSLAIILPVGISFYTFQTLSYTVDVYRGHIKPAKSIVDFSVYVSFFPQLVAGPIERATHFLPQVQKSRIFKWENIRIGFWLILLGYFKKVVIADNLAEFVNLVYNQPADKDAITIIIATYAFAFQIYGDFSGYSDIARGIARCFGFDLMLNFRQPYLARNPQEFWSRWHISLSAWLRDYLYIPLGGNRKGPVRTYINLMLTMLLGGLWHGANYNFVLWGGYQGALLAVHRWWSRHLGRSVEFESRIAKLCGLFFFFNLVCVGWFLFRVNSIGDALILVRGLMSWEWQSIILIIPFLIFAVPMLLMDCWFEKSGGVEELITKRRTIRYSLAATLVFLLVVSGNWRGGEFIYFQF